MAKGGMIKNSRKLSSIPTVVQLPGGITLEALEFILIDGGEGRTFFQYLPYGAGEGDDRKKVWTFYGSRELLERVI